MAQAAVSRECTRCTSAVDCCAFCDEPDCPSMLCTRCVRELFVERLSAPQSPPSPQSADAPPVRS